jgi:hypothetical protein
MARIAYTRLPMSQTPQLGPFRCSHCGNKTRFDVVEVVRHRRYYHYTLGGEAGIDEEEMLSREVESITCRWCDRSDGIELQDRSPV